MKVLHAVEPTFVPEKPSSKRWGTPSFKRKDNPILQRIEAILGSVFDHNCTLIYDFALKDGTIQAPFALLTPSGITLLYLSQLRGVFRATGSQWEQLDERRNRYRPLQPNPLRLASEQVENLRSYLAEKGYPHVNVQAAILFTESGVHVEATPNAVRLIYLDGFPRFAAALAKAQPTLTINEVHALEPILAPSTLEEALAAREIQDDFSLREEKPPAVQSPVSELPLPSDERFVRAVHKVPFSQRQLLVIAFLVIVNLVVLIALVLVILALS